MAGKKRKKKSKEASALRDLERKALPRMDVVFGEGEARPAVEPVFGQGRVEDPIDMVFPREGNVSAIFDATGKRIHDDDMLGHTSYQMNEMPKSAYDLRMQGPPPRPSRSEAVAAGFEEEWERDYGKRSPSKKKKR